MGRQHSRHDPPDIGTNMGARIQQYTPDQVRTEVVSGPKAQQAPAGTFDAPIARGVADLAQAADGIKRRVDTTTAEEALVAFERDKNNLFFDPDSGYFNTQGRNAYDGAAGASEGMQKLVKQYGENLNPQAKAMFDEAAKAHITRGQVDIARHSSKGLKSWEVATIDAQVENSVENAVLYWNDPERLRVQSALGEAAIIDSSEMQGLGAEATAERLQTFRSSFDSGVIMAATAQGAQAGSDAMEKYGSDLEGPDRLKVEKAIAHKTKVEKTQADAIAATAVATKAVSDYETRAEVIEEVNLIEDEELRKKTMAEAMGLYSRKKQAKKEQEANFYDEGIEHFNGGGTANELAAQNPEAWEGMTALQRNNLLAGKHMTTDQILLNDVLTRPKNQLKDLDPNSLVDKISPSDMGKVRSAIKAANKGQSVPSLQTSAAKANMIAEQFFQKKSTWKGAKKKKVQALLNAMQESIEEATAEKDGKLLPTEVDAVLANFSRNFVAERSRLGFDFLKGDLDLNLRNTPPRQVEALSEFVDQFGEESLQKIVDRLDALGKDVTAVSILNTYQQVANQEGDK